MPKFRQICLTLLIFLAAGCGTYQHPAPRGGTLHMPLLEDRTLHYRQNDHGRIEEYTLKLRYLGGESYKVYAADVEGAKIGGIEFMSHKSEVTAVTQLSLTSLKSRLEMSEFLQLWVNEEAQPGDLWQDEDTGTQTVMAGFESVTVPAGTFTDCYKTATEALPELADSIHARHDRGEMNDDAYRLELEHAKLVIVRWFAPNVGLVKEQIGSTAFVRELIAVENEGWHSDTLQSNTTPQN